MGSLGGEWWSYRPADFLMFAPRAYWRLFELQHQAWWPSHLACLAAGLAAAAALALRRPRAASGGALLLALASGFAALGFVAERFEAIFWAARLQTALLLVAACGLALAATGLGAHRRGRARGAALALLGVALLAYPLLAPASGRPWSQAEMFALAPDPTAVAVLAWVLGTHGAGAAQTWGRRIAGAGAALSLLFSASVLALVGSWQALVPLAVVAAFGLHARHEPVRACPSAEPSGKPGR